MLFIWMIITFLLSSATVQGQEKVDGGWTEWSIMADTDCSKHCDTGEQTRVRTCTNPKPQNRGADCTGEDKEKFECNTHSCEEELDNSEWQDWSACSTSCGKGVRDRVRKCVDAKGDEFKCDKTPGKTYEKQNCTEWEPFNKTSCPSTCNKDSDEYQNIGELRHCPERAKCEDGSADTGPERACKCVMGYQLDESQWMCKERPPVKPTPRPIPTMSPVEKTVAVVVSKTASTVILIMVSLTLGLFLVMRVFTVDRVIQMNMEISILLAHLVLLIPNEMSQDNPDICKVISICLHFFFTSCFMFLLLESLHVFSMVAFVVTKNGLMNRMQNIIVGWGVSILCVIVSVCFFLDDYGAEYHCWLQLDKSITYLVVGPIICMCIMNFVLLEASGAADYKPLKHIDHKQLLSSKIHQRSNLILMPMILASMILGMLSDYEQNLPLYSIFSILNTVIGVCIFIFHTLGNEEVRAKVKSMFSCCFKSST